MTSPARTELPPETNSSSDRLLSSWKEIATYLGKSVRTVQRWESELALPVRRPGKKGVVLAYPAELEQWVRRSGALLGGNHGNGQVPAGERFRRYAEIHQRAATLRSVATRILQSLVGTTDRTRALCAALEDRAAFLRAQTSRTARARGQGAPVSEHSYREVTVDDGGRNVESGRPLWKVGPNPHPAPSLPHGPVDPHPPVLAEETLYTQPAPAYYHVRS